MATKKSKPKSANSPAKLPEDLKNMDIRINKLGQIEKDYNIDDINEFLNRKVKDKKLTNDTDSEA